MSRISIAKALRLRKTLKGEIAELGRRASGCVAWVEGKRKDFDYVEVDTQRKAKVEALVQLETAIARSNATATATWQGREVSLAELIRRYVELKGELTFVGSLTLQHGPVRAATGEYDDRHRPVYGTETWSSAYTEPERVKLLADLRTQCETLNETLEEANHRTLVEIPLP
jgi:hypothetical protein